MKEIKIMVMKLFTFSFIIGFLLITSVFGQDSDNIGEDFDLESLSGILEKLNTLEELEKFLNDSTNDINNLDLDKDGVVDYVLVQEEAEGETHIVFLRVAVTEDEFQDIATIEMEKLSTTTASFQIVGDELLYGADYILEPEGGVADISDNTSEYNGEYNYEFSSEYASNGGPFYSVPPLPAVRLTICVGIFRPGYIVFFSPWGFGRHPTWFRPWRPIARATFRARSARWHSAAFRRTAHHRSAHAKSMHMKHRKTSRIVHANSGAAKKSTAVKKSNNPQSKPKGSPTQKKRGATTKKRKR